ncbi:MAG: hypothetical protein WCF08_00205 [Anaerolineaceae bacterium]
MVKKMFLFILCMTLLVACGQTTPTPLVTEQPIPIIALPTREPSETPEPADEPDIETRSAISPPELAAAYMLPATYLAERLVAPAAADVRAIAQSQNGKVYLQRGGNFGGISLLDVGSGDVTEILPTTGLEIGRIFNGPGESVLMKVGNELWRLNPDGTHELWSQSVVGNPLFFAASGEIYAASDDRTAVLRQSPGVSSVEVTGGFEEINDLVVTAERVLFVVDGATGDVVRVDPSGSRLLLDAGIPDGEVVDISLDGSGNLYRNSAATGFAKIDPQGGQPQRFDTLYSPCTSRPGDFVITENGMVIFIDSTTSQVVWGDLATGQNGVMVSNEGLNSGVVDIGPDGALYMGISTCGGAMPSQIVRVGSDGSRQVAYDGISGRITALAYDLRGGVYLATASATSGNRLMYYPAPADQPYLIDTSTDYEVVSLDVDPNSGNVFATLSTSQRIYEYDWQGLVKKYYAILPREPQEYDLAIAGDGQLFAYMSEKGRYLTGPVVDRYLLKLITVEAKVELIRSFQFKGCCPTGSLVAEPGGTLWLLVMPEGQLWRYPPEGEPELFARNLPSGTSGLAVNLYGDIFLTTPGGIYRFYRSEGP